MQPCSDLLNTNTYWRKRWWLCRLVLNELLVVHVSAMQSWAPAQPPSSWGGTGEPTPCLRRASRETWRGNASRSCATRRRPGRSLRTSQRRWEPLGECLLPHQPHVPDFNSRNSHSHIFIYSPLCQFPACVFHALHKPLVYFPGVFLP